jgi:hypothetical protein
VAKFVKYNYKKILLALIITITIPIWLTLLNFIFDFVIEAGRITGTIIRYVGSGNICQF